MATASDNFNRANGNLASANWLAWSQGIDYSAGGHITSNQLTGTGNTDQEGSTWQAASFGSDQFSELAIQATITNSLGAGPGDWLAVVARASAGFANGYLFMQFYLSGTPGLQLYKRTAGTFSQLGSTVTQTLSPGDVLRIETQGTTIRGLVNGVTKISVTDSSFSTGAPGIGIYGLPIADNWNGGDLSTGPQTVNLTGLGSAQAFGAPSVTVAGTANPVGLGSAQRFGVPSASTPATTGGAFVLTPRTARSLGSVVVCFSGLVCSNSLPCSGQNALLPRAPGSLLLAPLLPIPTPPLPGGDAIRILYDQTLSVSSPTWDLTGLDFTGVTILQIYGYWREVGAGDTGGGFGHVFMRFNNDSTMANYAWSVGNSNATGVQSSNTSNSGNNNSTGIMISHTDTSSDPSALWAQTFIRMGFPADTTRNKSFVMQWAFTDTITGAGPGDGDNIGTFGAGHWNNTAAITRLTFFTESGGSLQSGCRVVMFE